MSTILSFIGWTFLPDVLITRFTLTVWYLIITRAGDPLPATGSPRYVRAHKRVFIATISLYLLYTMYDAYLILLQTPTFYDLLSVPINVSSQELKSRFRRLTVLYHPDKAGAAGAEHFVALKLAYDTLSDPMRRFAYDRFGENMLDWQHCTLLYDYVVRGAQAMIPYYGISLVVLVVLTVLGKFELGRWWRFYALTALAVFEFTLLSRPYPVLPIVPLAKPLLAFEQVTLARTTVLTAFIAFNQLGPFLAPKKAAAVSQESLEAKLGQLAQLSTFVEAEAAKMQHTEFLPFENSEAATKKKLERKMTDWLVEVAVRSDPEVRDALKNAMQRRRQGAPPGAEGTR